MKEEQLLYERIKKYSFLCSEEGATKLTQITQVLTKLISGWPRRQRTLLVMNPIHPAIVVTLWEAGFDVTVQEESLTMREVLYSELGNRVDILPNFPDLLSAEDHSYDYIVAAGSANFWHNRVKVLYEAKRVACKGLLLLYSNEHFLIRTTFFKKIMSEKKSLDISPFVFRQEIASILPQGKRQWYSMLSLPNWVDKFLRKKEKTKDIVLPFPLGKLIGVRIDFSNRECGTALMIGASTKVESGV